MQSSVIVRCSFSCICSFNIKGVCGSSIITETTMDSFPYSLIIGVCVSFIYLPLLPFFNRLKIADKWAWLMGVVFENGSYRIINSSNLWYPYLSIFVWQTYRQTNWLIVSSVSLDSISDLLFHFVSICLSFLTKY